MAIFYKLEAVQPKRFLKNRTWRNEQMYVL